MTEVSIQASGKGSRHANKAGVRTDVVPLRHWNRLITGGVVAVLAAVVAIAFVRNPNIQWEIVGEYLFKPGVLKGLWSTLLMTILGYVLGLAIAVVIAVMRVSKSRILSAIAWAWSFLFRAIPLIVLLIFVGNLGLFMKEIVIGIPFTDIVFWSVSVNNVVTAFWASVLGVGLVLSGYAAEIIRSGIISVGRGQHEAAKALGLKGDTTLLYIVLPQAMRVLIPPLGNEFIGTLKATAIVSVIGGGELFTILLGYSGINYFTLEMLFVAVIWYAVVVGIFSIGQYFLERRMRER